MAHQRRVVMSEPAYHALKSPSSSSWSTVGEDQGPQWLESHSCTSPRGRTGLRGCFSASHTVRST